MHLKETLTKILKWFFGDTRSAIVSYIVVALIVAGGGLLALSKTALNFVIQIMTTPTPLWATISLVLLGCLYIYRKARISTPLPLPSPSPSAKLTKTKHIPFEDLIWTATKYSDGIIQVQDVPRCKEHDLLLTYDGHTYHCPEQIYGRCSLKLEPNVLPRLKRIATSYIDKQFRDEPSPPPPAPRRRVWSTGWRE